MRIVAIHERTLPLSRYADSALPSGGLTTSLVALVIDTGRDSQPIVGYGFASVGRFAQSGLIRERFAPRLLAAPAGALCDEAGRLDPMRAWRVMMAGEKPGGHGERCVAVGALDMALWDIAAKLAGLPLYALLAERFGTTPPPSRIPVYAAGGYVYPQDDRRKLADEIRRFSDLGFTRAKIKIGAVGLDADLARIDAAAEQLPGGGAQLAVDAMNAYDAVTAPAAAARLAPLGLWWLEDVCDPLDFETHAAVAARYPGPIAAGEALFSAAEAALLDRLGGLRRAQDILVFDPVHCYGLPGYLAILDQLLARGWPRSAFWPHGGHLFCLHLAAALGLGGAEVNPFCFQPVCGLPDGARVEAGSAGLPQAPGIGFELRGAALPLFRSLHELA